MKKSILKIAICDENLQDLKKLEYLLDEFWKERFYIEIFTKKYNSMACFVNKLSEGEKYDVIFIGLNGANEDNLSICKIVSRLTDAKVVIVAERSNSLALEAFEQNVVSYIVKEVNQNKFFYILHTIIDSMNLTKATGLLVNSKEGMINIPYYKIVFMDTKNHVVYFHLTDGKVIMTKTIRESFDSYIQPILKDERFLRSHYSFVVNMKYIKSITGKEVRLQNGEIIPVSNNKVSETKKRNKNYLK